MLIVTVRYEELEDSHRALLFNGCGPTPVRSRWWTWVPIPDLCFTECCNRHDFDYLVGGLDDDARRAADQRFLDCMLLVAAKQPWYWRWFYQRAAWIYFHAVDSFGGEHYVYRQPGQVISRQTLIDEEWSRRLEREGGERECVACACKQRAQGAC